MPKYQTKHRPCRRASRLVCEALEHRWVLASALIGIDFDANGFSPTNWNTASAVTSSVINMRNENGVNTTVSLTIASDGVRANGNASPPSFQIPIHSNPLDAIDGNIYAETGDTLMFEWSNLTPGAMYDVYHFGSDETPTNSAITIAGAGAPITFTRGFISDDLAVNDELGSNLRNLTSFAKTVAATSTGTISITVEALVGDAGTAGLAIQQVSVAVDGDFNDDGLWNRVDIDLLVAEISNASNNSSFDLTRDNLVNLADRNAWLAEAGNVNLEPGRAYLVGDATLDGVVDGQDFIAWNTNKFLTDRLWSGGDFTADGVTDGQDFIAWNNNKFMSSDLAELTQPAPEASVERVIHVDLSSAHAIDALLPDASRYASFTHKTLAGIKFTHRATQLVDVVFGQSLQCLFQV